MMNSLKFVTQINGVYQSTSSSRRQLHQHTICQRHMARKGRVQGRAQGVHLPSAAGRWQLVCSPPPGSMGGGAGPLRLATPQGLGLGGLRRPSLVGGAAWPRHRGAAAAGCVRLFLPAAARGSFSCWRRRAAEGPPQHEASAAAGGRGSFSRQRRGAPSAGGGAGQWPLASSIYGGWRVSS